MSVLKKIADWLDPGRTAQAASDAENVAHLDGAVNDLVGKLSYCAATTTKLRADVSKLRAGLLITRSYAMDAYDDAQAAVDLLGPRARQRPAALATVEAIKADLKQIADVLVDTSAGAAVKS